MKKVLLLLLLILPIVLLVIIAIAGRIVSLYQNIPVERIAFVDRLGTVYTDEHTFTVNQGSSKETLIMIYPDLATNKRVTYTSGDESICTVDKNGVITGVHYGSTTVVVKTDDGAKVATLHVRVKADIPFAVTLSKNELAMTTGGVFQLDALVDAPVAVNKNVTYTSDAPDIVKVDPTGRLTALGTGTATITVTTLSGGLTDTCTVTVEEGVPPLSFDFSAIEGVERANEYYLFPTATVDLAACLRTGEGIDPADVTIVIHSGSSATLTDGVLTFTKANGIVTVRACLGSASAPTELAEVKLILKN